jgi:hypothetical protein
MAETAEPARLHAPSYVAVRNRQRRRRSAKSLQQSEEFDRCNASASGNGALCRDHLVAGCGTARRYRRRDPHRPDDACSGPLSAFGAPGKAEVAHIDRVNDSGGMNGRTLASTSPICAGRGSTWFRVSRKTVSGNADPSRYYLPQPVTRHNHGSSFWRWKFSTRRRHGLSRIALMDILVYGFAL